MLGPSLMVWQPDRPIIKIDLKHSIRYLEFFLDRKLTIKDHIHYYANKGSRVINIIQSLGNSVRGMNPKYKRALYISNVLSVMLYGCQL